MLGKQLAVGSTPGSLVTYLFGPGRANEHTEQRLIVGSDWLMAGFGVVDLRADATAQAAFAREFDGAWRQARRERGLPLEPAEGESVRGAARADRVWHATISLGPKDGSLTDDEWSDVARAFVAEMGFIDSKDGADCAWFAVNHGDSKDRNDHIHIAVNLVREDGRRADIHQSKRRTAQAVARIAAKMGKEVVYSEDRSSGIGNVSRAEIERGRREDRDADRLVIRRRLAGASAMAHNEAEFVRIARAAGLIVRPRFAQGGMTRVVGYSAALADSGKPVWFAPSKLDRNLGLTQLRERKGWGIEHQLDAVKVWRERGAKSGHLPELRLPIDTEINKARRSIQEQGHAVAWRRTTNDLSEYLGAWSLHADGGKGGHIAQASDALSRASQPRRNTGARALVEGVGMATTVAMAGSKNAMAGQLALIAAAMSMIDSLRRVLEAQRELETARAQLERAVRPLRAEQTFLRQTKRADDLAAMPAEARDAARLAFGGPRAGTTGTTAATPPSTTPRRPLWPSPRQDSDRGRNE